MKSPATKQPATKQPVAKQPAIKPSATRQAVAKPTGKSATAASTTKGTRAGPTRAERLAAAEKARRTRTLRTRAAIAGGLALAVLVVAFLFISDASNRKNAVAELETGSCKFDTNTDADAGPGLNHVADPTYKVDPPAGGNHEPAAAPPGIYSVQDRPPDGQLVHSLEHGYVIVWYRTDLPAADQAKLRELAQAHSRDVLLVPRDSLVPPVAATAWHARLLCGAPETTSLERFVDDYVNQGPEKVPH